MDRAAHARHATARLMQGRPLPLRGRLLADRTRQGELVPLDPATGGELQADDRPAFVLSTEREATDSHILRQHWNLSRADAAGVPVLWNHDANILLGQWRELSVQPLDDGPALVGRAWLDPDDELAQTRRRQIRAGLLNAVSVRWSPGACVRRGELDKADPLYREPVDDMCGQPAEGFVMGTEEEPNTLIEASLTPIPADERAVVTSRFYRGAEDTLARVTRAPADGDLDQLLALLAGDARVQRWADTRFAAFLAGDQGEALLRAHLSSPAGAALLRDLTAPPPAPLARTFAELFPRK